MLVDLQSDIDENYVVVKEYWEAKKLFEQKFRKPYNYSAYVVAVENSSSCVQIYQGGYGFGERSKYIRPKKKDAMFNEGLLHEINFIDTLRDIWIKNACHGARHKWNVSVLNNERL